jgi:hypothetical protein
VKGPDGTAGGMAGRSGNVEERGRATLVVCSRPSAYIIGAKLRLDLGIDIK